MSLFDRKRHDSGEWTGFLEKGVKVEGKLETTGTFRIDSTMKGTLVSSETLILGENATIEGQVLSVPGPTTPAGTTADLILRETTGANTGQLDAFDLGSNSTLAAYPLGALGLNWQIMGLGAFAGRSEALWAVASR